MFQLSQDDSKTEYDSFSCHTVTQETASRHNGEYKVQKSTQGEVSKVFCFTGEKRSAKEKSHALLFTAK